MYTLQPAKKSSGCLKALAVIGVIALGVFGMIVLVVFTATMLPSSASTGPSTHRVVYKVTTDRDSSVYPSCYGFDTTYEMPSGTAQKSVSICDGAKSVVVDQRSGSSGDFVYLSVQNDKYAARIGCEIHIDGKLIHRTYSQGQYVIASCSGSVP